MAGEESDLGQPPSSRVTDRDLLWVESVSERLLGSAAPRAWERAFFRPEESEPAVAKPERPPVAASPPAPASPPSPAPAAPAFTSPPVPTYFAEGDADWRHDLAPEFPDDLDAGDVPGAEAEAETVESEPELVIDLTEPVRPQPPASASTGRIDEEILGLALGSGDTVLASVVILLLEDRSRDRQRVATLETALRALIEQVDRIDGPDHELAVTARLLRRVVE